MGRSARRGDPTADDILLSVEVLCNQGQAPLSVERSTFSSIQCQRHPMGVMAQCVILVVIGHGQ